MLFFDWEKKRDVSASGSCVFGPAEGSWSSSGGGEPEDGVVGDEEPGSGGEFIVVVINEGAKIRSLIAPLSSLSGRRLLR